MTEERYYRALALLDALQVVRRDVDSFVFTPHAWKAKLDDKIDNLHRQIMEHCYE